MTETLREICTRLEHYESPEWAVHAILKREILTNIVIDPCTGTGILAEAAKAHGYSVLPLDVHDWGYARAYQMDWLNPDGWFLDDLQPGFTVLINPPFSLATEFVEQAFRLGARKVVAFQRLAWWESKKRRAFWAKHPPNRIYVCGDRADCWRHDIAPEDRGSGTTTAHAWFVFQPDHPTGTLLNHIWRDDP